MDSAASPSLRERVEQQVARTSEPFLVPDVTPLGQSKAEVFHIVRDMVDRGDLRHDSDGYRRPS